MSAVQPEAGATTPPVHDLVAAREVVLSDLRAHLQLIALTVDTGTEHGQGKAAVLDDLLVALNDLPARTITPAQREAVWNAAGSVELPGQRYLNMEAADVMADAVLAALGLTVAERSSL